MRILIGATSGRLGFEVLLRRSIVIWLELEKQANAL
jgi:hypothetical protein